MNSFLEEKALLSIINTKISCGSPFPRLCAHRRASHVCPENTLPAFGSAIALGAQEIELDLWMSAGGVPVACHDSSVDRTTDGEGPITEMDWADIQCLRYQAWPGMVGSARSPVRGGVGCCRQPCRYQHSYQRARIRGTACETRV